MNNNTGIQQWKRELQQKKDRLSEQTKHLLQTHTPPNHISADPDAGWMFQTNTPDSQDPQYLIYTWTHEFNEIQTYPNGSYICLGIPTKEPATTWEMIVNKDNLINGRVMDTWPNPANWLIVDDSAEETANETNKGTWRNRGLREGNTGTKAIARVLRNNGWTSEERVYGTRTEDSSETRTATHPSYTSRARRQLKA